MRSARLAVTCAIAAAALAGCVADDPPAGSDFDPQWAFHALPWGDGHDHADPAHHDGLSTPNFEVLGFAPWSSDHYGGQSAGGYLCGDAAAVDGDRRLAAIESRSDVGFAIADVTDPTAPEILGEFVMDTTYIYDLAVMPDGEHVVIVTAGTTIPGSPVVPSAPLVTETDPLIWNRCGASMVVPGIGGLPYPMNVITVSIADPDAPEIVDIQPSVGYGHSAFPVRHDGHDLVLVSTSAPANPYTSLYMLFELEDTPDGAHLLLQSIIKVPRTTILDGPRAHDAWMQEHPVTGQFLGYLAGGDRLAVVDWSDLRAPEIIGTWLDPGNGGPGFATFHSVYPLAEMHDGRHYTAVGPEWGGHPEHTPTGINWILDTTDPTAPVAVGGWTLPYDVEWSGTYMFSNHYFTVVDTTLFVSMYHGGVWAVDIAPALHGGYQPLDSVGVFIAANTTLPPPAVPVRWAPTNEEVLAMPDGTLVTFDGNYGLYTLRFHADDPAPAPPRWEFPDP